MKTIYTLLVSFITMCSLDMIWLGYVARAYYEKYLSAIINLKFNLWPGVAFYLLYLIGVYVFVLVPGIASRSMEKTLLLAAGFGFMCYMTYDLTNMATVKDWPINIVIIDILWGIIITSVTAFVGYKFYFWME